MDNVETCWKKIISNIKTAAIEAIGRRQIITVDRTNNKEWYCSEMKESTNEKISAYFIFREQENFRKEESIHRSKKQYQRKDKRKYWKQFTSEMEHDLYGAQKKSGVY